MTSVAMGLDVDHQAHFRDVPMSAFGHMHCSSARSLLGRTVARADSGYATSQAAKPSKAECATSIRAPLHITAEPRREPIDVQRQVGDEPIIMRRQVQSGEIGNLRQAMADRLSVHAKALRGCFVSQAEQHSHHQPCRRPRSQCA